jgi:hypothetical protein
MATSEIEKLERRYAENPHGLTFAPLAEVHRKNGDITRALELLRIGLELHPNYIPASIVLGRCQQDLGDLAAAEKAFAHVLRLDDENVIALKSLADINERQDRFDDAERWLRRLVSVDRSNDEARQQLQRIQESQQQSSRAAPAPVASAEVALPEEITVQPTAAESAASPAAEPAPPSAPAETAPLDWMADVKQAVAEPRLAAPDLPAQPPGPEPEPESLTVAEGPSQLPGLETAEFEPPQSLPGPLGIEIETESDVVLRSSGAAEFSVPDASQDFAALAARLSASSPRSPGRRASDRSPPEATKSGAETGRVRPVEPPQAVEPPPPVEPPRAVEPPRPMEPPPAAPKPVVPARAYSARETNGQSIAAFFQVLLVARPPAATGVSAAHGPGNSGSRDEDAAPAASAAGQGKDELVSFDDFFASATGGSSVSGGGEPGKDDLDQFHTWLQNLKR